MISLIYDSHKDSKSGPSALGKLFGITRGAMYSHIKRMERGHKNIGRPALLTEEHLELINHHIKKKFEKQASPDIPMLSNWIYKKFSISISFNTLHHIIASTDLMKVCTGVPIESTRAEVPLSIIEDHYDRLESYLERANIPPEFFCNVDETGFQDLADKCNQMVVVPADFAEDETVISVKMNMKRATMIGAICAD